MFHFTPRNSTWLGSDTSMQTEAGDGLAAEGTPENRLLPFYGPWAEVARTLNNINTFIHLLKPIMLLK